MMRAERFTGLEGSSMSYRADFATADPANAPLDPPIMIGADPFFWAAILLMIAAAAFAGYSLGAHSRGRRDDAAKAIWKAIRDAAQSAMKADDNALKERAGALSKVIQHRLGKTLTLAGGLSGRIKKLDDAIAGRGPVQTGPVSEAPAKSGEGGRNAAAQGEPGQGGGGGGGGGAAAAASVTVVTIGGPSAPVQPSPSPPSVRDLTHREQTDALRLAVAALNEHWRDEAARVGELRASLAELSNPEPRR